MSKHRIPIRRWIGAGARGLSAVAPSHNMHGQGNTVRGTGGSRSPVDVVSLVASVVLGAAFVVAGASKLAAGPVWPEQARGLGAPSWAIPVVPWFELVLGAALVARVAPRPLALVALGLLVAFTILLAARLREGRHPPCACFGAWSARPLGPGHLVRNAGLIVLAVLAAL